MHSERISTDTDPLNCLNVQVLFSPHLANVAKFFLATPATSVPSERVFSAAGFTVRKQRSSLASENVDRLIFFSETKLQTTDVKSRPLPVIKRLGSCFANRII